MKQTLTLITGTGRSGTSTMSGSLHHLGLHVPGPYLGANESNPKGFFESRWSVRFHNALTREAKVGIFDSRPHALARVQAVITDEHKAKIVDFLRRKGGEHEQMVVKDPRTVWTQALWRDAAAEVGREIRYIAMLRHPAEVVGSRATYYAPADFEKRRAFEISNIARWVNNTLISEHATRSSRRAYVRYTDLLTDWRPAVARLGDQLGLTYKPDVHVHPHPVDDFIDPGLRRHHVTWRELEVPQALQEIAEAVWQQVNRLPEAPETDISEAMDGLADRYADLLMASAAISKDAIREAVAEARRTTAAEVRQQLAREAKDAALDAMRIENRPINQVGGRDLLRVALRRAVGRVQR